MVRRLDPWFVLIDCEKQREEMSVPIKIKSYFYLEVFFLSPTLISNSQLFFFPSTVFLIIRFHLCFLKSLVGLLSLLPLLLKYIFNEDLDVFNIPFKYTSCPS